MFLQTLATVSVLCAPVVFSSFILFFVCPFFLFPFLLCVYERSRRSSFWKKLLIISSPFVFLQFLSSPVESYEIVFTHPRTPVPTSSPTFLVEPAYFVVLGMCYLALFTLVCLMFHHRTSAREDEPQYLPQSSRIKPYDDALEGVQTLPLPTTNLDPSSLSFADLFPPQVVQPEVQGDYVASPVDATLGETFNPEETLRQDEPPPLEGTLDDSVQAFTWLFRRFFPVREIVECTDLVPHDPNAPVIEPPLNIIYFDVLASFVDDSDLAVWDIIRSQDFSKGPEDRQLPLWLPFTYIGFITLLADGKVTPLQLLRLSLHLTFDAFMKIPVAFYLFLVFLYDFMCSNTLFGLCNELIFQPARYILSGEYLSAETPADTYLFASVMTVPCYVGWAIGYYFAIDGMIIIFGLSFLWLSAFRNTLMILIGTFNKSTTVLGTLKNIIILFFAPSLLPFFIIPSIEERLKIRLPHNTRRATALLEALLFVLTCGPWVIPVRLCWLVLHEVLFKFGERYRDVDAPISAHRGLNIIAAHVERFLQPQADLNANLFKVRCNNLYSGPNFRNRIPPSHWKSLRFYRQFERLKQIHHLPDLWSVQYEKSPELIRYYLDCVLLMQGRCCVDQVRSSLHKVPGVLQPQSGSLNDFQIGILATKIVHQVTSYSNFTNFVLMFSRELADYCVDYNVLLTKVSHYVLEVDNWFGGILMKQGGSFFESQAYKDLIGFMYSFLLTFGSSLPRWIPPTIFDKLPDFKNFGELVQHLVMMPRNIYQAVVEFYATGSIPSYFCGGIDAITARANVLLTKPLPDERDMNMVTKRREMLEEATSLISILEKSAKSGSPIPEAHFKLLGRLRDYSRPPRTQDKVKPFVLSFVGPAGTGKSNLANTLYSVIAHKLGETSSEVSAGNRLLSLRAGNKHIDGVPNLGSVLGVIFDDLGQDPDKEIQRQEMAMLHALVSDIVTAVPMASVENKERALDLQPQMTFVCTNNQYVWPPAGGDIASQVRRTPLVVRVNSKNKVFSESVIPNDKSRTFSLWELVVVNGQIKDRPVTIGGIHSFNSQMHFLRVMSDYGVARIQAARHNFELRKNTPICPLLGVSYADHLGVKCSSDCKLLDAPRLVPAPTYVPQSGGMEEENPHKLDSRTQLDFSVKAFLICVSTFVFVSLFFFFFFPVLTVFALILLGFSALFARTFVLPPAKLFVFQTCSGIFRRIVYDMISDFRSFSVVTISNLFESVKNGRLVVDCSRTYFAQLVKEHFALLASVLATLSVVYYSRVKYSLQGNFAAVSSVPDNSTIEETTTRMNKIANMVRQKTPLTSTLDDVKTLVSSCFFSLYAADGKHVSYCLHSGQYMVTTEHGSSSGSHHFRSVFNTGHFKNNKFQERVVTTTSTDFKRLTFDVVAVPIPAAPAKDFRTLLLPEAHLRTYVNSTMDLEVLTKVNDEVTWLPCRGILRDTPKEVFVGSTVDLHWEVVYPFKTFVGMCGSIIVVKQLNSKGGHQSAIVGMHHAGVADSAFGSCRPLTREMFDWCCPTMSLMPSHESSLNIGPLRPQCAASNIRMEGICLGSTPENRTFTTSMRLSRLSDLFPEVTSTHEPPNLKPEWDPVTKNAVGLYQALDKPPPLHDIDVRAAKRALDDLIFCDTSGQLGESLREMTPLSFQQALDGRGIVKPINLSTSMGFPNPGPKSAYIGYDDQTKQRFLKTELVKNEITEYFEVKADIVPIVTTTFPKDEIRKKGKPPRWISIFPCFFLILCKMFLLPFLVLWGKFNRQSECYVGMNAGSPAWTALHNSVKPPGPDWFIYCIDFESWDRCFSDILRDYFNIYILTLANHSKYTDSHVAMLHRLLLSLSHVFTVIGGLVFYVTWYVSSGDPVTVFVNSWAQRFLLRYWYYHTCPDQPDNSFNVNVRCATYGDDGLGSCRRLPGMSQLSLAACVAHFGYKATSSDKTALKPEVSPSEVSFLRRSFRWDDEFNEYLAPLEILSIKKMLCWFDVSSNVSELDWCADVVENSCREMFLHGREAFTAWIEPLFVKCETEGIRWKVRTFDEYKLLYERGEFSSWDL